MNKLFKELRAAATTDNVEQYFFDLEKFARLLCEECAKICEDSQYVGWAADRTDLDVDSINQHLGKCAEEIRNLFQDE